MLLFNLTLTSVVFEFDLNCRFGVTIDYLTLTSVVFEFDSVYIGR